MASEFWLKEVLFLDMLSLMVDYGEVLKLRDGLKWKPPIDWSYLEIVLIRG